MYFYVNFLKLVKNCETLGGSTAAPNISFVFFFSFKEMTTGREPVAHSCNPSSWGGGDQKDRSSRPARANSPRDPHLQNN
jgi:hypothetical protein